MARLPADLKQIALFLKRLPGIGEKTANRMAFSFLRLPPEDLQEFAKSVMQLKARIKYCTVCMNLTEDELCFICADRSRSHETITIVEDVLDLLSFETGNIYQGVYHVLHGKIDPLNNVRPDDIYIDSLFARLQKDEDVKEVVLATNFDMEGEATAMYIKDQLKAHNASKRKDNPLRITRLAYGLPIGASLEYADYMTLKRAIEGRNEY
jgi:recombination protein RecR